MMSGLAVAPGGADVGAPVTVGETATPPSTRRWWDWAAKGKKTCMSARVSPASDIAGSVNTLTKSQAN